MLKFDIKKSPQTECNVKLKSDTENLKIYTVNIKNNGDTPPEKLIISFKLPALGLFSVWNTNLYHMRELNANWNANTANSRICSGAPTHQLIGASDENKLNISVLDGLTPISIGTGIVEETAEVVCKISFFTQTVGNFNEYETDIRIDTRCIPYYEVLSDVKKWWCESGDLKEAFVPETAKKPVNSIWYSFHQNIDVEKILHQCKLSKELGIESVIVDDGWQTDNASRGYAFCGDWKVCPSKVADMKDFVKRVHSTGLKFILWYGVPLVGIHSEAFSKFKGKIVNFNGKYGCFDPRYKDVREYLINTYKKAVKEWDLDGLKLDFIDSFELPKTPVQEAPGKDFESLEEAVKTLLYDINTELTKIKPDILIEFRQTYIGPVVGICGNMLRVADCPQDALRNRVASIDLRLISGKSAVHSDMIMWNLNDSTENAALQLVNTLFCVPQISMLLDKLPQEHLSVLKFYLCFWNENSDTLLNGKLIPENPEAGYSMVTAESDTDIIAAGYSKNTLTPSKDYNKIVFVNATGKNNCYIDFEKCNRTYYYEILNCKGNVIKTGTINNSDNVVKFDIPLCGMLKLI